MRRLTIAKFAPFGYNQPMHKAAHSAHFLSTLYSPSRIFRNWGSAILSFFKYPFQQSNAEQAKILWLVKLRWLAITLFIFFGSIAYALHLTPTYQFPMYIGIIGLIVPFNLFVQVYFGNSSQDVSQIILCLHMAFDLAVLTAMLFMTRGIENPFVGLYFLHACLGGLLIPGYLTLPFIAITHVCLAFLQLDYR